MINIKKHLELPSVVKQQLDTYIHNEFGHVPIVNETEWVTPDWTILYYENNQIASFYNIVEREILIDDQAIKTAGINNVMTPTEFRGKGFASKMMSQTDSLIFEKLKCQLGVLLCADALIPFYEKLNWYKIDCPVYFKQSNGMKLWRANTMFLSKGERLNPSKIDLNGLPW